MNVKPLLIREGSIRQTETSLIPLESVRDAAAFEDDLPAVLDRSASGYVLARATYVTEVKRETHDDN